MAASAIHGPAQGVHVSDLGVHAHSVYKANTSNSVVVASMDTQVRCRKCTLVQGGKSCFLGNLYIYIYIYAHAGILIGLYTVITSSKPLGLIS